MKKTFPLFCLFSLLFYFPSFSQTEINGVKIPETLDVDGQQLVLNGAGLRKKFFLKLYVGALFLPHKTADGQTVIQSKKTQLMRLYITSGLITAEKMNQSIKDGFKKSMNGNTTPLQKEIDRLMTLFKTINNGDIIDFSAGNGSLKVLQNNQELGSFESQPFKEALYGIWLGNDPVDDDLREELLGL
ncbi:MAG: chalcone isomerase family protein [Cytophagales bacterium]|nr:chalcone isomerase family protein [Cytophagales bacterium]